MTAETYRIAALLRPHHIRALSHVARVYVIFGWENYNNTEAELDNLGLIKGEWMGSLEMSPSPMWKVTELGREVLRELEKR